MHFFVTASSELPIYRQLMRQLLEAIASGDLEPGAKIPSHRELAEQLVIAPLTVKRSYDELEALGYLETHRGRGTFVSLKLPKVDRAQHREQLRILARKLLSDAYLGGLSLKDAIRILEQADRELNAASGRRATAALKALL